ncbi:unnamed protein product, partial [marine sediment metagenome]
NLAISEVTGPDGKIITAEQLEKQMHSFNKEWKDIGWGWPFNWMPKALLRIPGASRFHPQEELALPPSDPSAFPPEMYQQKQQVQQQTKASQMTRDIEAGR